MSIKIKFSQSELRLRSAAVLNLKARDILNVCSTEGGLKYYILFFVEYPQRHQPHQQAATLTIWQMVDAVPLQPHNLQGSTIECHVDLISSLLKLGLDFFPDKQSLKLAYKNLCKQHHPDVGGDPARFREISDSYQKVSQRLA